MGDGDCRLVPGAGRLRASLAATLMGDRSFSRRSTGLQLLVRLISVVAALLVLCLTGRASAATPVVPMCGEHNESIAAPPIFRNVDGGSLRAAPCRAQSDLGFSQQAP